MGRRVPAPPDELRIRTVAEVATAAVWSQGAFRRIPALYDVSTGELLAWVDPGAGRGAVLDVDLGPDVDDAPPGAEATVAAGLAELIEGWRADAIEWHAIAARSVPGAALYACKAASRNMCADELVAALADLGMEISGVISNDPPDHGAGS